MGLSEWASRVDGDPTVTDYDVIVIGAGHNALVAAGYIARAGYKVGIFERRHVVGGAVVTEEHVPGFQFDLGGSAHLLINSTPIVDDLHLANYGLDYIDIDPLFFAPFPDGTHFTIWRDVDQTCQSIATFSEHDAEAYRKFIDDWMPLARGMVEAFNAPPPPVNFVRHIGLHTGTHQPWEHRLRDILGGYGPLLRRTFESEQVPALIAWMAAQSGPPPTEALSAPFALWHPMYHVGGMRRPRGGSGMLTQALARMIEDHGGAIHLNSAVASILVESGRACGIETQDGQRATARAIVSGAHIYTTLGMLAEEAVSGSDRALVEKSRVGNGFGFVVRYAVEELPDYTALPSPADGASGYHHRAMQFICPSLDYLDRAYADYMAGRPSTDPALISMTWTAVDPTLAPEGKHVMFIWGQYYPYELASGEHWDDIAEREADRLLNKLAEYAPNVKGAVIDKLIETPVFLERTLGLLRGNVMHLEMSVDQMFMMRPALTMSSYRGPVKGLYLTGASTHPGGGIMGASGRNAALTLLSDLSSPFRQFAR
ncbi:MAG: NAD(P)/FAD-dependent oxidoreductase [Chloroflexi bacterium]|nr:NAD(P)/FAD-dependent oxidoreductase [Chloroflexota bacterium]